MLTRGDFVTANTARPSIPGTPRAGLPVEAAKGTWKQTALTNYTYQWLRCDAAGNGCVADRGRARQDLLARSPATSAAA